MGRGLGSFCMKNIWLLLWLVSKPEAQAADPGCVDTPNWDNGNRRRTQRFCSNYASNWCENGAARPGSEWTLGSGFNYPENNCCVCGSATCATSGTCTAHQNDGEAWCQLTSTARLHNFQATRLASNTFPGKGLYTLLSLERHVANCCYDLNVQVFMGEVKRQGATVSIPVQTCRVTGFMCVGATSCNGTRSHDASKSWWTNC